MKNSLQDKPCRRAVSWTSSCMCFGRRNNVRQSTSPALFDVMNVSLPCFKSCTHSCCSTSHYDPIEHSHHSWSLFMIPCQSSSASGTASDGACISWPAHAPGEIDVALP